MRKPKPCPFCGCQMQVSSNSDWHRLTGEHPESCMLHGWEDSMTMVPATPDQLEALISDWNSRAPDPDIANELKWAKTINQELLKSDAPVIAERACALLREIQAQHPGKLGFVHDAIDKLLKPVPELDERMKAVGMIPVSEMLKGAPLDSFFTHAGVCDLNTFTQWVEMKRAEYLRSQGRYDLGERDKTDDLYEWTVAHAAVFGMVHVNLKAALKGEADARAK